MRRRKRTHTVRKNSMPKFLEVIGKTEKINYCHTTIFQTCVLAVPLTIKVGVTKFGNQESTEVF